LFGCSTGGLVSYLSPTYGGSDVTTGVLVSYLSPAYGGSDVTIDVPTFFKEKK